MAKFCFPDLPSEFFINRYFINIFYPNILPAQSYTVRLNHVSSAIKALGLKIKKTISVAFFSEHKKE